MDSPTHNNGDSGRRMGNWSRRFSIAALVILTTLLILYISCIIRPQGHPNDVFYTDLREATATSAAESQLTTTVEGGTGTGGDLESVVPPTTPTTPSEETSTDSPSSEFILLDTNPWDGAATASVAERIYASDVVVRASLLSTTEGSLRFRAVEYLKGSGPSEFTVSASTVDRDTSWDGREAVLFLSRQSGGGASGSARSSNSVNFQFADTTSWNYSQDPTFAQSYSGDLPQGYTVDSRNPVWLPAESEARGESGASSGSSFITASTSPADGSQPIISLADLRTTIAWVGGGEGIEGYDLCIRAGVDDERYFRDWEAYHKRPYERYQESHEISSGAGASTVIYDYDPRRSTKYHLPYLSGPDASLFFAQNIDDDTLSSNGYYERLSTARPMPAGTYKFVSLVQLPHEISCAFRSDYDGLEYLITVTAPTGTLHEAFFDPVDLTGGGAGATGSSGEIDPDEFTVGSDDYEIESLIWRNNSVVLTLDDHVSLSGYSLDFLELDGSIDTTLDVSDATVNQTATTWTWSVTSAPWEDGDQLMLRIREASTTSTPVP